MYGGRRKVEDRGYRAGDLTSTASGAGTEWGRLVESTAVLSKVAAVATEEATVAENVPRAAGGSSCGINGESMRAFGSVGEGTVMKVQLPGTRRGKPSEQQQSKQQQQPLQQHPSAPQKQPPQPQPQPQPLSQLQPQPQPQPQEKKRPPALETTVTRTLPAMSDVRMVCPLVGMIDMLESPRGEDCVEKQYASFSASRPGRSSSEIRHDYSPEHWTALGISPAKFPRSDTMTGAQEERQCGVDRNGVVWHAEQCVLRQSSAAAETSSVARSVRALLSLSPKSDATSGDEVAGETGEIVVAETRFHSFSPDLTELRSGSRCWTEKEGVRCNHELDAKITVIGSAETLAENDQNPSIVDNFKCTIF